MTLGLGLALRWEMIEGRKISRSIVEWVITHYEFSDDNEISEFYYDFLALQTRTILLSKRYAEGEKVFNPIQGAISADLENLVNGSFESGHPFWDSWKKDGDKDKELLDFSWSIRVPKHPIKLRDQPLRGGSFEL